MHSYKGVNYLKGAQFFAFNIITISKKEMPINYIANILVKGPENTAGWQYIRKFVPPILLVSLLKLYFNGSSNTWQRDLHGKVYIITGGTSGIGSALVRELAARGAQLVILTSQLENDNSGAVWTTDYVDDLREATRNPLIYVEQCDLSSLYSVRKFATKWLDNRAPRRLDGIICLASERVPPGKQREASAEGVEKQIAVNYLGHYHLLTLLIPAIKSQPIDRDVRIVLSTCSTQALGAVDSNDPLWENKLYPSGSPWKVYGSSKLMLHMFAKEFQRRLDSEHEKKKNASDVVNRIRVNVVNPGIVRTPSLRRFISFGSIFGILLYLILYPIYWILFKSSEAGMQSFVFALSCPNLLDIEGGQYIRECKLVENKLRKELEDKELQKELYENTAKKILELEKTSAIERNRGKNKARKDKKSKKAKTKVVDKKLRKKGISDAERSRLFKSAFNDSKDVYPDIKQKDLTNEQEAARNSELKRLDEKYEAAQKKATANKNNTEEKKVV